MKKIICLLMLAAALLFVFSCQPVNEPDPYAAPEVKTAADLPDSGATSSPSGPTAEADAIALYSSALQAFGSAMMAQSGVSGNVKGTTPIPDLPGDISWIGEYGGGTISVTGNISGTMTSPDSPPTVPGTYDDLYSMVMHMLVNGTITGVTFDGVEPDKHTYKISGDVYEKIDMDCGVNVTITTSSASMTLDLSIGMAYGVALSIYRDDDFGAKFVITFGGTIDANNLSLDDIAALMTTLGDQLKNKEATLKVYGDDDKLICSATLTLDQLVGQIGGGM